VLFKEEPIYKYIQLPAPKEPSSDKKGSLCKPHSSNSVWYSYEYFPKLDPALFPANRKMQASQFLSRPTSIPGQNLPFMGLTMEQNFELHWGKYLVSKI